MEARAGQNGWISGKTWGWTIKSMNLLLLEMLRTLVRAEGKKRNIWMKQTVENIWTEEREREHLLKKVKKTFEWEREKTFWKHLKTFELWGERALYFSRASFKDICKSFVWGREKHILKTFANHLNGRERKHLKTFELWGERALYFSKASFKDICKSFVWGREKTYFKNICKSFEWEREKTFENI